MNRSHLHIFLSKPAAEKWLLLKIFMLLACMRLYILIFPFKSLSNLISKEFTDSNLKEDQRVLAKSISLRIENVSKVVPWKATCLVQAAAAKILLNNRGIPNSICFGVNKENKKRDLQAHAWLKVDEKIVLGGEIAAEFVQVSTLS